MNTDPALVRQSPARSHRTPRYVYNRTRQLLYERAHPDDPWLTPAAIGCSRGCCGPWTGARSSALGAVTLWFAARVAALTSVEHDQRWHEAVTARLKERGLGNVEYILATEDQPMERGGDSAYARTALAFPDASLDFALVDGHYRDYSAKFVMPKIRPGGMLIIDNVNWYLPCRSKAPNSRTAELGPAAGVWAEVWRELAEWRTIWTSSGVWDTAIFIRPSLFRPGGRAGPGPGSGQRVEWRGGRRHPLAREPGRRRRGCSRVRSGWPTPLSRSGRRPRR